MVLNNQEAKILIGKKDAYITSTMSQAAGSTTVTSQSVNFVDTGIKLYVTPTINRDGFVTMKIKPEISTAEPKNILSEDKKTEIPIVETSETETTVMVKDGVTIIIGGLRKDERNRTEKRIPILGDIPLIGALFRNTSDDYQKRELVILLTPHIISGENSFTDFSEIKPREGAVFKMEKNEIVAENINSKIVSEALINYSETLNRNITRVAKRSLIKANGIKGEAALSFTLSAQGKLINGPEVISASDPVLVPLAIKAIKDAAPFPKFPTELGKLEETFRITLQY